MKYKYIENNILSRIGDSNRIPENGVEITEEEYKNILSVIQNKPSDPEPVEGAETMEIYMLKADTLTYELVTVEVPTPKEPEQTYTLDKAAAIIAEKMAANE